MIAGSLFDFGFSLSILVFVSHTKLSLLAIWGVVLKLET